MIMMTMMLRARGQNHPRLPNRPSVRIDERPDEQQKTTNKDPVGLNFGSQRKGSSQVH